MTATAGATSTPVPEHTAQTYKWYADGKWLGARLLTGGTYDGLVYQPTILTDVPYEATASNEETFGPLVIVEAVDTPEDAVAVANRVQYGLTSSILSGDTYRALELAPKIL